MDGIECIVHSLFKYLEREGIKDLVCVDNWSNPRQLEFAVRKYRSGDKSFTYKPNL